MANTAQRRVAIDRRNFVRVRALFAVGAVLVVVGVIWLGQGVGLIGGSFMTGETVWAAIGGACIATGAYLVRLGFRWRQGPRLDEDD